MTNCCGGVPIFCFWPNALAASCACLPLKGTSKVLWSISSGSKIKATQRRCALEDQEWPHGITYESCAAIIAKPESEGNQEQVHSKIDISQSHTALRPLSLGDEMKAMKIAKPSRTALGVAVRRACHQIHDSFPLVLDDPIAVPILGDTYRQAIEDSAASINDRPSLAMRAWLVARNRFAEEKLAEAVARGVQQYVLLGAGLDTFAHRNPHPNLRVFEVDHPATQMWKHELLLSGKLSPPKNLHYVPVDFERQSLLHQLEESCLDLSIPAVFAWLGVVLYLTPSAFRSTLDVIAAFPKGSGVIFDYALPRHALAAPELEARDNLSERVAGIGEPFQLFFTPAEIAVELSKFSVLEDLDATALNSRYFANRTDQLSLLGRSANIISAWR
jgi:methyltransferase (TIGR00027 family)